MGKSKSIESVHVLASYCVHNIMFTDVGEQSAGDQSDRHSVQKSPHVRGGVHEECAWLPLMEAQEKSPVFGQIYKTTQFMELLASMEAKSGIL